MKKSSKKTYLFWILLSEAVGGLSAFLTRSGMQYFTQNTIKPPLTPPPIVFPIVWAILYALMGISAARISIASHSSLRSTGLNLFVVQLIFNFFWSLIFFQARSYGFALIWLIVLWLLVAAMILVFRKIDPVAAYLQIPYLIWLTLAAYLNYGVWTLN